MRLVFMGTPEYAATCLKALLEAGHEVVGVFTQPDRPKGRSGAPVMPPAKVLALQEGIPVFQPVKIRHDGMRDLAALKPEACVTAAFGQILSEEILAVPPLGTVNVHASLLPRYRGPAPVNWAIINGESVTGVTTMMTDKGIDTGDILLQKELAILRDETAGGLTIRLAQAGAELLVQTLGLLASGACPRTSQNGEDSSYYPMLSRQTGFIRWANESVAIANLVRGVQPWPGALTQSPWGQLKVLEAQAEQDETHEEPGTILAADARAGLLVKAGQGALRLMRLQAPGGKAVASADFLRGHRWDGKGKMQGVEVTP